MAKGQVIVITGDKALITYLAPSMTGRKLEAIEAPNVREAVVKLSAEEFSGVVADCYNIPVADREALLNIHKQKANFPLFVLETLKTISPGENMPLRRLPWPLPAGFADQVRATETPVVFLTDQTLFASRALQTGLQQAGVQSSSLDSHAGLSEFLLQIKATPRPPRPSERTKPRSFWQKLGGAEAEAAAEEESGPRLSNVVVVLFKAPLKDAEAFDARLRQSVPDTVCYYVSSLETARAAAEALSQNFPAVLIRDQAGRIATILHETSTAPTRPKEKERVLLLDNYKPTLDSLSSALGVAGYEVTSSMDGEQALRLASKPGTFHLAVIGTAIAYAQHSGAELAQKLREVDPDIRIIFMVDRYPLQAALQGVSQVVELGLDDALLKPVEASRLIFSVQKAMSARFLLLENARLLIETQEKERQLAQINGFQKKFFAMVAHDVKNPLTAILGYSEVLGMRLKDLPNELKCASHIHSAARTLNTLISDLVDLAAIESGKLRVNIGSMDLGAVVGEVKSRIDVVAQQRQITFTTVVPPGLPSLAGDPARIGQVIQNLCTNGIQYTKEKGSVTIQVDPGPDMLTVSVIDTGIGIKKEDLPRVFERFFQTQEAQAMRKAGFGLGLKIAREIVQMHGGEMGIESEYGKGSRFFFTLPVPKGAQTVSPAAPAAAVVAQAPPTPAPPRTGT
jgi:signal transduction histidine kinase